MRTCIQNVRIITASDDPIIESGILAFDETGILQVGAAGAVTGCEVDVVIDGTGMTVMPGLMDCHVHLGMDCSVDPFLQIKFDSEATTAFRAYQQGQQFLQAGITTVRNLGTRYNADIAYRNAVAAGIVDGPRIYAAGQPIVMTGGHGHVFAHEVDGVDEVRKAARTQLKAGADLLKVMATGGVLTKGTEPGSTQLGEEELRCACTEAAHVNKTVAAHAIGLEGVKNAIRAGVTTVEHGYFMDDEAVSMLKNSDAFLVPTLMAATLILDKGPDHGIPEEMIRKSLSFTKQHRESFRKALVAGVKVVVGTDAGTPFNYPGLLVDEMQMMIDEGMSPFKAIQSATKVASECMKIQDSTGTLEVGKWADVLLVGGNPLKDIQCLKNVILVYKGGVKCFDNLNQAERVQKVPNL